MPPILDLNNTVNAPIDEAVITRPELPVPLPVAVQGVAGFRITYQDIECNLDPPTCFGRQLPEIPTRPAGEPQVRHQRCFRTPRRGGCPKTSS